MSGFEVIRLLHYGKCNDVFVSRDSQGNLVAVKRFYRQELSARNEYTNSGGKIVKKDWAKEFRRSIDVQKRIKCEFCIGFVGAYGDLNGEGENKSEWIELVYEFAECGSLMSLENFEEPIPKFPKEIVKCVAKDIVSALDYLSRAGIAHRDVKPDNIFMTSEGRFKLGDFGESCLMEDGKVKGSRGSLYFMAPEALSLDSECMLDGTALDMWALGITILMLYFAKFPFKNPSSAVMKLFDEIRDFCIEKKVEELGKDTNVEDDFVDFIRRILDKDPRNRITPGQALVSVMYELRVLCQEDELRTLENDDHNGDV